MYFHLIGIKEKDGNKYDLNLILKGGDEDFIRSFLANRGVVIVSINEYKEDPNAFGNIIIVLVYNGAEIQLITKGEDLSESMNFIISLGLRPISFNFADKPIPEDQMKSMIESTILSVEEENQKIKQQEEFEEIKERKKYEESGIKDGLKIINSNIDHIEQVLKAGQGVLSSNEIKELENYLAEMKKIRLGTNFNKMTSLILDAHVLLQKAEKEIFAANEENKFLIDKNSAVTNIDVLNEYFNSLKISERAALQPAGLAVSESAINMVGTRYVFLKLLRQDITHSFDSYSFDDFFDIILNLIEFITLWIIIVISLCWLFGPLLGYSNVSLYLLPAMGWLGVLIYLLKGLGLKGFISRIVGFIIIAIIYWYGLTLLLNTFAL